MKFLTSLTAFAALVAAVPQPVALEDRDLIPTRTQPLEKRATTVCGQWDSVQTGGYTIYNNLWGRDSGTGSQCLTVDGIYSGLVRWSTSWSWSGGPYNVKSYPNAVLQAPAARVSAISTMPSKWQWRYVSSFSFYRCVSCLTDIMCLVIRALEWWPTWHTISLATATVAPLPCTRS